MAKAVKPMKPGKVMPPVKGGKPGKASKPMGKSGTIFKANTY
jgi:hypothetical protein